MNFKQSEVQNQRIERITTSHLVVVLIWLRKLMWSPIGLMGKLLFRDDGTCEVNSYCRSNDDGIATASECGYRVMNHITENIIKVLIK